MNAPNVAAAGDAVEISFIEAPEQSLPLVIRPREGKSLEDATRWLQDHRSWLDDELRTHGALLLRGFEIFDPHAFEDVALAVEPNLQDEYLGTSPRAGITQYVFTSSELPDYYPIPQHCEMTFIANPPRRLFFCCLVPPIGGGGETPLVDFRKVYRDMDPEVLQRFIDGGIRIIRNYSGPNTKGGFDLWKLKRWDEMFGTTDRAIVDRKCAEQGFETVWRDNDKLTILSEQPAVIEHPETGEPVWFSHLQVFHLSSAPAEYRRIYLSRPELRTWGLWQFSKLMVESKRRFTDTELQAMHCTYRDGSEIPLSDIEHLRDVIWQNMVAIPWLRGDVFVIDNHSVSHGRLPYRGQRQIAVAWA